MGKTKTLTIGEEEKKKTQKKSDKVHVAGLKGGQRIKAIEAEPVAEPTQEEDSQGKKKSKKARVRGKKYQEARAKIDKNKHYSLDSAIKLIKETTTTSFDGTVELHAVIKKTGFSTNLVLPHTFGKQKKVEIASDETVAKLEKGKIDFDVLLSTPDMMPKLVKFARLLGPKGLMPNPKNGTIIKKASDAQEFSASGKVIKTEREAPVVHTVIGKVSMKEEELKDNLKAVISALGKNQTLKAYLSPTMGPSIKLAIN